MDLPPYKSISKCRGFPVQLCVDVGTNDLHLDSVLGGGNVVGGERKECTQ